MTSNRIYQSINVEQGLTILRTHFFKVTEVHKRPPLLFGLMYHNNIGEHSGYFISRVKLDFKILLNSSTLVEFLLGTKKLLF